MPPFLEALERLRLVRDGYYSADAARSRRAAMLLALDRGTPVSSVARLAGCSRNAVYYWLRLYRHHRDPEALASVHSRRARGRDAAQAADLNSLRGRRAAAGCLALDPEGRRRLKLDAAIAPDPARRRRAAILWALDRGVPAPHVAHVAGVSRQAVHRMRRRAARA